MGFLLELFQKNRCSGASRTCNSSITERCPAETSSTQEICRIYLLNCAKRGREKVGFSVKFSENFLLRILNISQKVATFDIESDIKKSSFSSNPDKNNWTSKIGLSHPGITQSAPLQELFWIICRRVRLVGCRHVV